MNEIPDQIGERLRRARENAGLAVEDVVFQTRLPRSAVEALEADNFSHFISPVYAKSFLAQYSEYLAVDATLWLDALQPSSFIEGDPMLPLLNTLVPPHVEHSHHHHHAHLHGESNMARWFAAFWLLAISCVMVFAAVKAYQYFEERFSAEDRPRNTEAIPNNPPTSTMPPEAEKPPEPPANSPPKAEEHEAGNRPPRAIIVR